MIKGNIRPITNVGEFDIVSYLKTHKIASEIFPTKFSIYEYSDSFFNKTRSYIHTGNPTWKSIAPLLLLGEKTKLTKEVFSISKRLSILHLFVISGFHIGIVYKVVLFIFEKLKMPYCDLFSLMPIIVYVFLLNWSLPALRALIFIVLTVGFGHFKKIRIFKFDVIGIVGMLLVSFNPFLIESISFQLTFIATLTIMYLNTLDIKSKSVKYFIINFGVFLATLPIVASMNGWISLWGVFYSIALTPLISLIYVLSLLLIPFKSLLSNLYYILLLTLKVFNKTVIIIKTNFFSTTLTYNYYIIFTICILFMEKRVSLSIMRKSVLSQNSV
nr:ComEC/Rec2 family competence protein [Mycoplasma todarodis]